MTMQTIVTKYLGPTTFRGSRIKAVTSGGRHSVTIDYPHELDSEAAHWKAASLLIRKLEWPGVYHCGALQTGFVFVPDMGEGRTV
jgi:hypothetical protein